MCPKQLSDMHMGWTGCPSQGSKVIWSNVRKNRAVEHEETYLLSSSIHLCIVNMEL